MPDRNEKAIDEIFKLSDKISLDTSDLLDLENKICISIGIRLKAEMFMIKKINNNQFVENITKNQYFMLIDRYRQLFPSDLETINLLEQVNLMTPENIHLNSFMYEPILDMSNHHLKTLYKNISKL